jgi:hypothetical protein
LAGAVIPHSEYGFARAGANLIGLLIALARKQTLALVVPWDTFQVFAQYQTQLKSNAAERTPYSKHHEQMLEIANRLIGYRNPSSNRC